MAMVIISASVERFSVSRMRNFASLHEVSTGIVVEKHIKVYFNKQYKLNKGGFYLFKYTFRILSHNTFAKVCGAFKRSKFVTVGVHGV